MEHYRESLARPVVVRRTRLQKPIVAYKILRSLAAKSYEDLISLEVPPAAGT